jgi:hypothetical protein
MALARNPVRSRTYKKCCLAAAVAVWCLWVLQRGGRHVVVTHSHNLGTFEGPPRPLPSGVSEQDRELYRLLVRAAQLAPAGFRNTVVLTEVNAGFLPFAFNLRKHMMVR